MQMGQTDSVNIIPPTPLAFILANGDKLTARNNSSAHLPKKVMGDSLLAKI